ncbi:MAG: hypothetical protein ACPH3N_08655 [Alcanivorax sediminis]|uniref:Uncharacterized protein n=1 Tax=Alcanivorax sediminis TaxID=2663008 RepID=A0A6N7LRF7_9GAMM|nr:hypothetical protein [Alcanivorax sediminis]MQX52989.1 hypothetical protein [Alcanivorax sediminis]
MDGHKTALKDWKQIIETLRQQGKEEEASAVEAALEEGKKVRAIQLIRACGLSLEEG